jgi:hypothetical protein
MEALLLVAELGGPTMFARIGVMRALNRNVERVFNRRARAGSGLSTIRSPAARSPARARVKAAKAFQLRR